MANLFLGKRVLIVEDDAVTAFMLADILRELGFGQVDTAYSLASGLLAVRDARPSIALLDINLTDGISLRVAEVLAGSHIPSVFMSGDPGAEKEHGLVKGTLLIKPFSPAQLQDALMKVLAP